ncbi:uncharacterized protein H6S33_012538 [Morchella sextelata]|uniref:uncharacterized protein n=1 Tax=Morchella sextelata TaxID=1174677 RepID=UPI001D04E985|nr:uncharacterized protein H6S33_012538 [Morchella sextelata]KAH0609992.1 hypothetical protein H6S33_012538 [Morchella sextelata]
MYSIPSVNFASIRKGIHNTLLRMLLRSTDIHFRTAPPTCRTLPFTMFSSQRTIFRNGPAAGATRRRSIPENTAAEWSMAMVVVATVVPERSVIT